jgi:hypothetical protein
MQERKDVLGVRLRKIEVHKICQLIHLRVHQVGFTHIATPTSNKLEIKKVKRD